MNTEVDLKKLTEEETENIRGFLTVITDIFTDMKNQSEKIIDNESIDNDKKSEPTDPKNNGPTT